MAASPSNPQAAIDAAAPWARAGTTLPQTQGCRPIQGHWPPGFGGGRGATLALHSTVGFGPPASGAWGTGAALDIAGGPQSATGWLLAFSVLAAGISVGPLALLRARMAQPAKQRSW